MVDRNIEIGEQACDHGGASPWSEKDTRSVSIVIGKRIKHSAGLPPFVLLKVYCPLAPCGGKTNSDFSALVRGNQ